MKNMIIRSITTFFLIVSLSFFLLSQPADQTDPDPKRYQNEIETFLQWDAKNSYPENAILFVGSSSIRMWPTHLAFPAYPAINRGFGGAHISDVIFYYETVIKKYQPGIIVFYAGDNDVAAGKPVAQVFEDYKQLIAMIKADNPSCQLIYLPIKPSISRWHFWPTMEEINSRIENYNQEKDNLYYLDLATPMIGKSGRPNERLFIEDGLHLNAEGYALWQALLHPLLDAIFNQK
jgi:lysophospholipase L1-like esterase